ncbi:MAG: DUF2218 domain-containing protein [Caulobacteraceae bacterium]|nr:DUF2218 domain-containing protein [Caulobacteraceae bacterium]
MADTTPTSLARTETVHASRYLQQLAKHWSHKFEVNFTPMAATIDLPLGRCELAADAEALEVTLKGTPHVDMERFKTVVAEHLQRFGHRETLTFDWRDATPA